MSFRALYDHKCTTHGGGSVAWEGVASGVCAVQACGKMRRCCAASAARALNPRIQPQCAERKRQRMNGAKPCIKGKDSAAVSAVVPARGVCGAQATLCAQRRQCRRAGGAICEVEAMRR